MANEIIKVIDELCKKFGIAVDWTSENVIPYAQQLCEKYINFEIWTSVLCIVLWGITLIGGIIFFTNRNKALKKFLNDEEECNDFDDAFFDNSLGWIWVLSLIVLAASIVGFITVVAIQSTDIITCLTFPEKMILEYVQGLLSQSNA